ncbi:hypothetical protein G6F70_001166 [Rhizopus microsporus]|uniref:Peroxisomal membrane protein PEX16 n=1 Tax=Rhizopus microsporus TaxID=58291 RepID=A0A1X0S1D6_RHIZD|nr:hypothetical protein G6F71_003790 [Rhizopus microsporus]KAG1203647.1 hypothetical protein G6F70_001166 [Rhizopus microsporus]KAG1210906.1 hypothetical protein G6F69_005049 [Rhizopus microsporus]KAG1232758.1 hypothetical protein G6F67_004764 [Rhizopus microsporus]KAG1264880.1 hypothetical protein G6F68_004009 [Rhizopus microsporus]
MKYFQLYEEFLIKNASQITSIESSLRSLTFILPGRFQDAELASQALYAALNLVDLYHNSIIRKAILARRDQVEESAFNKYIHFWSSRSNLNATASSLLSVILYTQVLIEMAVLKKYGKKRQWECIAYLEGLKVMLRLFIFQTTGQRMTLSPPHLKRDIDPQTLAIQPQEDDETWVGKRTGIRVKRMKDCFQTNSKSTDVTDFLLSRKLTADMLRKPDQMVTVQKNISKLGELMYILRPLIYVMAILKWGKRSWRPWIMSLAIELLSQAALKAGYRATSDRTRMMPLEKDEFHRRRRLLLLNAMRGIFYLKITRPRLESFCNRTEDKPILSLASNIIREYLPLWQDIYFYTSAS